MFVKKDANRRRIDGSLEDVNDKARGFDVGGNDYVTKPFEILEVRARVRSLFGVSEAFDANDELFGEDRLLAHLEARVERRVKRL